VKSTEGRRGKKRGEQSNPDQGCAISSFNLYLEKEQRLLRWGPHLSSREEREELRKGASTPRLRRKKPRDGITKKKKGVDRAGENDLSSLTGRKKKEGAIREISLYPYASISYRGRGGKKKERRRRDSTSGGSISSPGGQQKKKERVVFTTCLRSSSFCSTSCQGRRKKKKRKERTIRRSAHALSLSLLSSCLT